MDKLKLLEIVANLAENESNRTWQRFSIMLTINTGLIALVSIIGDKFFPISQIIGSLFGITLSFVWLKMIPISKYYEKRWHEDMLTIINSDTDIKEFIKGRSDKTCSLKRPTKHSASSYSKILPISIGLIWFLIGVFSIFFLFNSQ